MTYEEWLRIFASFEKHADEALNRDEKGRRALGRRANQMILKLSDDRYAGIVSAQEYKELSKILSRIITPIALRLIY